MKKRRDWSVAIAALVLVSAIVALLWYSRMGPGARALATPVLAATDEGVWAVRGRGEPELIYRWQSDRHILQYPAQWMWGEVTLVDDDELMTADEDGVYEAADWGRTSTGASERRPSPRAITTGTCSPRRSRNTARWRAPKAR